MALYPEPGGKLRYDPYASRTTKVSLMKVILEVEVKITSKHQQEEFNTGEYDIQPRDIEQAVSGMHLVIPRKLRIPEPGPIDRFMDSYLDGQLVAKLIGIGVIDD
jgi:hypothetical protein